MFQNLSQNNCILQKKFSEMVYKKFPCLHLLYKAISLQQI